MGDSSTFIPLTVRSPELEKEWHPTKNGDLKPTELGAHSRVKVWWLCSKGHDYPASVQNRYLKNSGCPYCKNKKCWTGYNDLETLYPYLAKLWHPTKNGDVKPSQVLSGSTLYANWLCPEGHEWEDSIRHMVRKNSGCLYCQGKKLISGVNDFATLHPDLLSEWDYSKNSSIDPTKIPSGCNTSVWWKCKEGHEWQVAVSTRVSQNTGCALCGGKAFLEGYTDLRTCYPEIASLWHPTYNGQVKPSEVHKGSSDSYWWLCGDGHSFERTVSYMVKRNAVCPSCTKGVKSSFPEFALIYYLKKIFSLDIEHQRTLNGVSIDIYLPSMKLAIEYDGYYWHRDKLDTDYNKNVTLGDIRMIRLRENGLEPVDTPNCYNIMLNHNSNIDYVYMREGVIRLVEVIASILKVKPDLSLVDRDLARAADKILSSTMNEGRHDSLASKFPTLVKYLSSANKLTADKVAPWASYDLKWVCDRGHEDIKSARNVVSTFTRSGGYTCSYCSNKKLKRGVNDLATTNPDLAKEWHPTKNGELTPYEVFEGTGETLWWRCRHGHEWSEPASNRKYRLTNCRECRTHISVYSKLVLNGEILGVRFFIGVHLVDIELQVLEDLNFSVNLESTMEEEIYEYKDLFVTKLEIEENRTVTNLSNKPKRVSKLLRGY